MTDVAHVVVQTVAVALAAASVSGIARRIGVPAPIALVAVGLGVSVLAALLPVHVPAFDVDPELVLYVFLPPLLYSAALESSYLNIRRNLRPILHLSVGLVVFTTAAVACVAHWFAGLPWVAAFVLGAVVAPPDAVAATALGRTLGLPRRLLTILGGESLFNDATALTLLRLGILAATAGAVTYSEGARTFVVAAVGGVAIGLLLAPAIHQLRIRLREPVLENAFAVLLPFAVYVLAETFDASGVLAVVVLGLYLGHREAETTFAVRLQARAVWRMIDFLLESVVFLLIGLEIAPIVQRALRVADGGELVVYGLAVLAVVILARIVWVFGARLLPRGFSLRSRTRDPGPSWSEATVLSWAGMRGVVSLAAALAIPRAVEDRQFPGVELVLYLTVCVVFGTLVLHGLTLPWLVRRLGVAGGEGMADVLAEAQAQHAAARAAIDRLDALLAQGVELPDGVEQRLRDHAEHRANSAWERLGRGGDMTPPAGTRAPEMETPAEAFRRLRRDMLTAERDVFVDMRNSGRIDDEVLRRVLNELDLEEAMLARN